MDVLSLILAKKFSSVSDFKINALIRDYKIAVGESITAGDLVAFINNQAAAAKQNRYGELMGMPDETPEVFVSATQISANKIMVTFTSLTNISTSRYILTVDSSAIEVTRVGSTVDSSFLTIARVNKSTLISAVRVEDKEDINKMHLSVRLIIDDGDGVSMGNSVIVREDIGAIYSVMPVMGNSAIISYKRLGEFYEDEAVVVTISGESFIVGEPIVVPAPLHQLAEINQEVWLCWWYIPDDNYLLTVSVDSLGSLVLGEPLLVTDNPRDDYEVVVTDSGVAVLSDGKTISLFSVSVSGITLEDSSVISNKTFNSTDLLEVSENLVMALGNYRDGSADKIAVSLISTAGVEISVVDTATIDEDFIYHSAFTIPDGRILLLSDDTYMFVSVIDDSITVTPGTEPFERPGEPGVTNKADMTMVDNLGNLWVIFEKVSSQHDSLANSFATLLRVEGNLLSVAQVEPLMVEEFRYTNRDLYQLLGDSRILYIYGASYEKNTFVVVTQKFDSINLSEPNPTNWDGLVAMYATNQIVSPGRVVTSSICMDLNTGELKPIIEILEVSGDVITAEAFEEITLPEGSELLPELVIMVDDPIIEKLSEDKFFLSLPVMDDSGSLYYYGAIVTIEGSTITVGDLTLVFDCGDNEVILQTVRVEEDKLVVLTSYSYDASWHTNYAIISIDGTEISVGSEIQLTPGIVRNSLTTVGGDILLLCDDPELGDYRSSTVTAALYSLDQSELILKTSVELDSSVRDLVKTTLDEIQPNIFFVGISFMDDSADYLTLLTIVDGKLILGSKLASPEIISPGVTVYRFVSVLSGKRAVVFCNALGSNMSASLGYTLCYPLEYVTVDGVAIEGGEENELKPFYTWR